MSGAGTNLNVPLAPGTGDEGWLVGLARVCEAVAGFAGGRGGAVAGRGRRRRRPGEPAGRDACDGYEASGALVRGLGVPVVAVHEGGYHLPTLGSLTVAVLEGVTGVTSG